MGLTYRFDRIDSYNRLCPASSATKVNATTNACKKVDSCGPNWNGDSILLRIWINIDMHILGLGKLDGWQYRRCLHKNYNDKLTKTAITPLVELIRKDSMKIATKDDPFTAGEYLIRGYPIEQLDAVWNAVKEQYGTMGLPVLFKDHKDPVTGRGPTICNLR